MVSRTSYPTSGSLENTMSHTVSTGVWCSSTVGSTSFCSIKSMGELMVSRFKLSPLVDSCSMTQTGDE